MLPVPVWVIGWGTRVMHTEGLSGWQPYAVPLKVHGKPCTRCACSWLLIMRTTPLAATSARCGTTLWAATLARCGTTLWAATVPHYRHHSVSSYPRLPQRPLCEKLPWLAAETALRATTLACHRDHPGLMSAATWALTFLYCFNPILESDHYHHLFKIK